MCHVRAPLLPDPASYAELEIKADKLSTLTFSTVNAANPEVMAILYGKRLMQMASHSLLYWTPSFLDAESAEL